MPVRRHHFVPQRQRDLLLLHEVDEQACLRRLERELRHNSVRVRVANLFGHAQIAKRIARVSELFSAEGLPVRSAQRDVKGKPQCRYPEITEEPWPEFGHNELLPQRNADLRTAAFYLRRISVVRVRVY